MNAKGASLVGVVSGLKRPLASLLLGKGKGVCSFPPLHGQRQAGFAETRARQERIL